MADGDRDVHLQIESVTRAFGGLVAVDVHDIAIERSRITALIGPNGAGKTTLFNIITGFDRGAQGQWYFEGQPFAGKQAYEVARAGMVRTFQLTRALARMTVLDNMRLAARHQTGERLRWSLFTGRWRDQERRVDEQARTLLARFGLSNVENDYAGTLSGGQRKLLEMARALMVEPRLLLLDEPMAGVNPALVESLLEHVQSLRDEGMTIMFVEHDMDVVMHISDHVVCMGEGKVIADGPPEVVASAAAVIEAYLGAGFAAGAS